MTNYVVTIRTKDGSLSERDYTANDRAELFQKLAADGVTAVRVSEGVAVKKPRKAVKKAGAPSKGRGLVAAAIVVLVAGGVAWFMWPEEKKVVEVKKEVKKSVKAEPVRPVKEKPVVKAEVPVKIDPNARPTKVGEVVNGYVMLPSGRIHKRQGVVTNFVTNRPKGAYAIFKHNCENEIACFLSLKPGDTLIGTPRYNGRFKAEFLKSLNTSIEITDEDTPEQAQLKRDVSQAKMELKAAYDRGEDIEQIMLDTRQELQDLMRYKMDMQKQFNEIRLSECKSEAEVEVLLDACNKMLEQKGIAPMKFGPITRRKLMSKEIQ